MNNSHKTAITRNTLSRPMRYLSCINRIAGTTLDYGCGKGFDADTLCMDKYDLIHTDDMVLCRDDEIPPLQKENIINHYDTITCNYVLNVIDNEAEREQVLDTIHSMLSPEGYAFITVRRDIQQEGYTSKGTYQENIVLDLPVFKEVKNQYCIYIMDKGGEITE